MEPDRCLVVDWSAANRPVEGADSIWIADAGADGCVGSVVNPSTRTAAMAILHTAAADAVSSGERLVIGVDAGFGYPTGFARALAGDGADWSDVWRTVHADVVDGDDNRSNRFVVAADHNRRLGGDPGPFWACPPSAAGPHLTVRRGPMPMRTDAGVELDEYRLVERHLRARSRLAHSVWKLFTPGSVGSQTLLAIARLEALRRDPTIGPHTAVWPFQVDPATLDRRPLVVLVEVWPELADPDLDAHPVRDAAQVRSAATWIMALAADGRLGDLLLLADLDAGTRRIARTEEGWILAAERA